MIRIFNRPTEVSLEEYDRAIASYVERVRGVAGVRSVFLMGSIKAPGLSDIDVIVVVEDDYDADLSRQLSVSGFDRRLFIHGPVVVPVSMASTLQYIIYASGLKRLYGDDELQSFDQLEGEEAASLRLAYTIDFLESRQGQYARVLESGRIDQRAWMARLWSLTHSEFLLRESGVAIASGDTELLGRIRALRANWLQLRSTDDAEFMDVFERSVGTSRSLWLSALHHSYQRQSDQPVDLKLRSGNKLFEFRECIEDCECSSWTVRIPRRNVTFLHTAVNPLYAVHLSMYGYLDREMCPATTTLNRDCLSKRALKVRQHQSWIRRHCPDAGSMSGYTGIVAEPVGITRRSVTSIVGVLLGYSAIRA